jgi:hypothetical protein
MTIRRRSATDRAAANPGDPLGSGGFWRGAARYRCARKEASPMFPAAQAGGVPSTACPMIDRCRWAQEMQRDGVERRRSHPARAAGFLAFFWWLQPIGSLILDGLPPRNRIRRHRSLHGTTPPAINAVPTLRRRQSRRHVTCRQYLCASALLAAPSPCQACATK